MLHLCGILEIVRKSYALMDGCRRERENFLNESMTTKNTDNTLIFNLKASVVWSLPILKPSL